MWSVSGDDNFVSRFLMRYKKTQEKKGESIQYGGLQMNKGARKVQEMVRRTDLRDDEVDGHFCHGGDT
jgi:hypothetical protein